MDAGTKDFNILLGGIAGEGLDTVAHALAAVAAAHGWEYFLNSEFHNVIKGANSLFQIRIARQPVISQLETLDLVLAFDRETVSVGAEQLKSGGLILCDQALGLELETGWVEVPFSEVAKRICGKELYKNILALGYVMALIGADRELVEQVVVQKFADKGAEVTENNLKALAEGFKLAEGKGLDWRLDKLERETRWSVSGNLMAALGAVKAGCRYFAAYPMTPSTSVLQYLAQWAPETGMSVNHSEDELAAINSAIGAGYAGVRAMVATSGGGYALMTEALGLAGMAEIPVITLEVQRPGPSTGLPTRTGQGDLRQVLHAGQGEYPHIVMAPRTMAEMFEMIPRAFEAAERFHCPVTVMSDKYLAESWASVTIPEVQIPLEPRIMEMAHCPPGTPGGRRVKNSYEHEVGGKSVEDPKTVRLMNEKRMSKILEYRKTIPEIELEGAVEPMATLVCWGSTYGPAKEALKLLKTQGVDCAVLCLRDLRPLPPNIEMLMTKVKNPILVEGNYSGQLGGWLREQTGWEIRDRILDYSGRPFTPEQIALQVQMILNRYVAA